MGKVPVVSRVEVKCGQGGHPANAGPCSTRRFAPHRTCFAVSAFGYDHLPGEYGT